MNLAQLLIAPEKEIALGVLRQALDDLGRFQHTTRQLQRFDRSYRASLDSGFSHSRRSIVRSIAPH